MKKTDDLILTNEEVLELLHRRGIAVTNLFLKETTPVAKLLKDVPIPFKGVTISYSSIIMEYDKVRKAYSYKARLTCGFTKLGDGHWDVSFNNEADAFVEDTTIQGLLEKLDQKALSESVLIGNTTRSFYAVVVFDKNQEKFFLKEVSFLEYNNFCKKNE